MQTISAAARPSTSFGDSRNPPAPSSLTGPTTISVLLRHASDVSNVHLMRTTLDIDADVLAAAKEISARTKRTAGQVISDLARAALGSGKSEGRTASMINGFEVISAEGRIVTPELVQKLAEEMDLG